MDSDFLNRYGISYIGLNMKPDGIKHKPFFIDKKVRRAIAYTIPIDEIIEVMLHGKATRQASNISPLKKTYNDTLILIPLDIEKAKKTSIFLFGGSLGSKGRLSELLRETAQADIEEHHPDMILLPIPDSDLAALIGAASLIPTTLLQDNVLE